MDKTERLLKDFVEHFNRGVETGDFRALLKLFAPDATLWYSGVKRGPYFGRDAIQAGYRSAPPDDELEILDHHYRDGQMVVGYSWMRTPHVRAGEMRIVVVDDMVQSMEVVV